MSITQIHGGRLRDTSIELSKLSAAVQSTLNSVAGKASLQGLNDVNVALKDYVGGVGVPSFSGSVVSLDLLSIDGDALSWVGGLPQGHFGEGDVVNGLVGVGMGLAERIGDLATLNTTGKTSAVAAINELKTSVDAKQATLGFTPENAAKKGQANGYASLDETGKVPASQLPSYVDDVIESADFSALPATGESGKIYVTLDNGNIYRWSGSAYLQIGQDVGSADTALKLATARTIALGGELSGSAEFDGSGDVVINATMSAAALAAHFVRRAAVSGVVDGVNKVFTLVGKKLIADTEDVRVDGQDVYPDDDYVLTESGADTVLTFVVAPYAGSRIRVSGIKA